MDMNIPRYNIDTCAVLVEFNASVWTARKLDKSTTEEVVTNKNAAAKDAARVNKNLLAGRTELDKIQQIVSAARTYLNYNTMPWSDNGQRMLPQAMYLEVDKKMTEFGDLFWAEVRSFIDVYPTLIVAQAMALGDMFKRQDYPTQADISQRFAFSVNCLPVPTAGDFRIDVGNSAMNEARDMWLKRLEKLTAERVEKAMADVRARLGDHLKRMSDRLTTDIVDGEPKARRIYDSVVDGALELCDVVKALNVVQDPSLEAARYSLECALIGVTPDELRKNEYVREGTKKAVDAILEQFNF